MGTDALGVASREPLSLTRNSNAPPLSQPSGPVYLSTYPMLERLRIGSRAARATLALFLGWWTALSPGLAGAENQVSVWGNYYKERSTRVISPEVTLSVDLPETTQMAVTYLVDNITSASGTFQATVDDDPFQEFRQEVRVGINRRFWGWLTPTLQARYSFEPDYTSLTYGLELAAQLFENNTSIKVGVQRQNDAIMARGTNFEDTLDTWRASANVSQVLTPELIVGTSFETQFLDGYTENPYRAEEHPRERERFALSGWAAYRMPGLGTTVRASYRYYWDSWSIEAHTFGLRVFQRLTRDLEIVPEIRISDQTGFDFRRQIDEQGITFSTSDPKLMPQGTTGLGLRLILDLKFLEGGIFHPLRKASLNTKYMFFAQRNSLELNPIKLVAPDEGAQTAFGDAHIVQLGLCWPF